MILRKRHVKDSTCIDNQILLSQNLTLAEKGLLVSILGFPDDFRLYKKDLPKLLNEKPGTINSAFSGLQKKGYVVSQKCHFDASKHIEWVHIVAETLTGLRQQEFLTSGILRVREFLMSEKVDVSENSGGYTNNPIISEVNPNNSIQDITLKDYQGLEDSNSYLEISCKKEEKEKEIYKEKEKEENRDQKFPEKRDEIWLKFIQFHKLYPGQKDGKKKMYELFPKKAEKSAAQIADSLIPCLELEKRAKELQKIREGFAPSWKNLKTWINNLCWEQEFPGLEQTKSEKQRDDSW